MVDKFKHYIEKNIRLILKSIWGIVLFSIGIYYIYHNYARILVSSNTIDNIIIAGTLILAFLPFISEISMMGFSVKKEIQNTKQEMKDALIDLKYQMVDIKATTTQNTTQNINLEYLPSKEEINNTLNKTDETKVKVEGGQEKIENQDEFEISDNTVYLFTVRFKLEKYISKICQNMGCIEAFPLLKGINTLRSNNIITSDTYQILRQLLNICNRGVHGEIISEEYINFAKEVAPRILTQLKEETKSIEHTHIMICPKCGFRGNSEYENVCPKCGFVSDDY